MPIVYRLAKKKYPVYDGAGAAAVGGRWNSPGRTIIYATEHYATTILETLVRAGRLKLPGAHHAAPIFIPDDARVERFDPAANPGWDAAGSPVAREFGDGWFDARRTPVLLVPSVPGQPVEWNVLINPLHAEAGRIRPLDSFDIVWDARLFGPAAGTVSLTPPALS